MSSGIEDLAIEYIQTVYPTDARVVGRVRDIELERHCVAFARALLEEARKMAAEVSFPSGGDYTVVKLKDLEALVKGKEDGDE